MKGEIKMKTVSRIDLDNNGSYCVSVFGRDDYFLVNEVVLDEYDNEIYESYYEDKNYIESHFNVRL